MCGIICPDKHTSERERGGNNNLLIFFPPTAKFAFNRSQGVGRSVYQSVDASASKTLG